MTCHTFEVLRQIYGDKFWSAPELTPQRSLRLAPSFCLASVAWICLGSLYCPRSKLMIDELVASFKLVEKIWMGTQNTYWHTYVQTNSESTCVWTPIASRFLTLTSHSENVSNVQVLGPFADWPFDCVELFRIWTFSYCFDELNFLLTVVWWLVIPSKFSDKFMGTNSDLHQNWLRREAWDWRLPFVWLLLLEFAWGACIVQGPSWWLMNWLHPSSWLQRYGWAHRTRTGTLTCRLTLKVHVFELLSHPAFWHSQVIQKTSIKCTSSWPFFWLTLWLRGIVSHLKILLWYVGLFAKCGVMTCHTFKVLRQIYGDKFWSAPELTPQRSLRLAPSFCLASVAWICLGSLYCPRSKLMIDELVASFKLVEKKWMGTQNTYWHTYMQSNSESTCFWTPFTSRFLTLTSHSENVYQMYRFLALLLTDPLIVWNCFAFEYFHIALMCWTFYQLWCDDLSYLQSSPTNLWGQILICTRTDSAEKLEIGAFLLFGFCCLNLLGELVLSKVQVDDWWIGCILQAGWKEMDGHTEHILAHLHAE